MPTFTTNLKNKTFQCYLNFYKLFRIILVHTFWNSDNFLFKAWDPIMAKYIFFLLHWQWQSCCQMWQKGTMLCQVVFILSGVHFRYATITIHFHSIYLFTSQQQHNNVRYLLRHTTIFKWHSLSNSSLFNLIKYSNWEDSFLQFSFNNQNIE